VNYIFEGAFRPVFKIRHGSHSVKAFGYWLLAFGLFSQGCFVANACIRYSFNEAQLFQILTTLANGQSQ
jgi:hypothetical protein